MEEDLLAQLRKSFGAHFEILESAGEGGAAVVFRANEISLGRQIALKVLRPEISGVVGDRFVREMRVTARLQHRHIITLLNSGVVDGFSYFTMLFVAGGSLRARLKNRDTQNLVDLALRVAHQIGSALSYAHQQGVYHRDVKPENILFGADDCLLADFGIAKILHDSALVRGGDSSALASHTDERYAAPGTLRYMSPEQIANGTLDGRSDQFSLACVLYEILSGSPPFAELEDSKFLISRVSKETPKLPPLPGIAHGEVSEIRAALAQALSLEPTDRFETIEEFLRALPHPSAAARRSMSPPASSSAGEHRPSTRVLRGELWQLSVPGTGPHSQSALGSSATKWIVDYATKRAKQTPAGRPVADAMVMFESPTLQSGVITETPAAILNTIANASRTPIAARIILPSSPISETENGASETTASGVLCEWRAIPSAGLGVVLVHDLNGTESLGLVLAKLFEHWRHELSLDAAGSDARVQIPTALLGLVVTHRPLRQMVSGADEDELVIDAIADAEHAKRTLSKAGVHLSLHSATRQLSVYRESGYSLSDPTFVSLGSAQAVGPDRGFNIVRYLLARDTGEARILLSEVSPHGGVASEGRIRASLSIPGRRGRPARLVRVVDRISEQGDSLTEWLLRDLDPSAWSRDDADGTTLNRHIRVIVEGSTSFFETVPEVELLGPATASWRFVPDSVVPNVADSGHVRGSIVLETTDESSTISARYRLRSSHSYQHSLAARVRCYGTVSEAPGVEYDREIMVHVLREPTERLEIILELAGICTPFQKEDVRTFLEDDQAESLSADDSLRLFSEVITDVRNEGRTLTLLVDRPVTGVGYGLTWRLPEHDPGLSPGIRRRAVDRAIADAERLRQSLWRARSDEAAWQGLVLQRIAPFGLDLIARAREAGAIRADEEMEIALFLPKEPMLTHEQYKDHVSRGLPLRKQLLKTLWTSQSTAVHAFDAVELSVPNSVGGRAYTTNQAAEYLAPGIRHHRGWDADTNGLDPYQELKVAGKTLPSHEVLYALPIRHWSVDTVTQGCVCLGSFNVRATLDFRRIDSHSGRPILEEITHRVKDLFEKLWNDLERG